MRRATSSHCAASNLSNLGAYAASFVPLTKGTELMSSLYRIPAAHVAGARPC